MKRKQESSRKVLLVASVASMLDLFNRENIRILQESGCKVEVAANFSFGNITSAKRVVGFRQELERMDITVHDIPIPRRAADLYNMIRSYRMLKTLYEQNHYCLLHTQSPIGGALSRLAARKEWDKGMCVVYMAHGFHFYRGAPIYCWLFFYPVEKWLSAYTDTLITINAEDNRRAGRFYAGRTCRLPGIGIDLEKFRPDAQKRRKLRSRFGFQEQDFIVISVGQLSRRKNQEVVIRAMAQLKDKNIRCLLVGLGERREKYHKLIKRLGLEQQVCLAGYRDDIPDLLQAADCFVFPSRQEGLPAALMEAMAAGLPIVCSRIRGNCDLVRDGIEGRIVDADDAAGFADAIRRIYAQPELADRYRKHAMEQIRAFSKEQVNRQMEEIYRQCLPDA